MSDSASVLVTGAAGFVGSHVVDRLLAGGRAVDAVDNLSTGSIANLDSARAEGSMRFHQMDVRGPDFVDLVGRVAPEAIIHLAGHVDRPGSLLDPLFDADVNVLGTLNVLESVRAHEIAKVAVVAHGLFRREGPTSGRVIVGQEPRTPAHIAAEAMVDYARVHGDVYGLDVRVVSLTNVYGPRQRAEAHGPAVANFLAAASAGAPMQIQGDGSQTRDFLYVDDAVDAIVRSLDAASGSIIPVGSGVSTSVRDLASLVVELTHSDVEPTVVAPRAIDRPGVTFPTEDAAQAIGWQPWTSLRDGLAATIAAG